MIEDGEIQIVETSEQGPRGPQGIQGPPGTTDHSQLTHLDADDHPQYLNATRADIRYHTKQQVETLISQAVGALLNGAPGALDTLKELADALGDDANFAATVTASLAEKADLIHAHVAADVTDFAPAVGILSYTKAQVDTLLSTAIDDLKGGASSALDTLNELAAALGNDANFAATVTTALAGKLDASRVQSKVWVPSDMTGATDVTAELENFVAANPGYMVKVPDNAVIKLKNAFKTKTNADVPSILLDFGKATILYDNNTSADAAIYADNTSNASANRPVTAIALALANNDATVSKITIATSVGANRFDWLALYSDNPNPAKAGGFLGEIVQVFSDESNLDILLTRKLNRHDFYNSNVQIRKLDRTRRLHIRGGRFKANGNTESRSITQRCKAIVIQGWVDPYVEDVLFDAPWAQCVQFVCCAAPRWQNIEVRNVGNMANYNGYIYGVQLYGMNDCADGRNIVVRNGRHAGFTTDGNNNNTGTWHQRGIPTNFVIDGVHGYNCNGSVVDTHEEGDGGTIRNVTNYFPYQDEDIAPNFSGITAQLRCANTVLTGVRQYGGTGCIKVNAIDHGFEDRVTISDVQVYDTTQGALTDNDSAINVVDQSGLANKRHVFLDNAIFSNVGKVFLLGKSAPLTLTGDVTARGIAYWMDTQPGVRVRVYGQVTINFRNNNTRTAPYTCHILRSDATLGGASVWYMVQPILVKGNAANKPLYFFQENDTTATKSVYVANGGPLEVNIDNVTPTEIIRSTSTSIVWAPEVSGPANESARIITAAGAVSVRDSDRTVLLNKTIPEDTALTLPKAGVKGRLFTITDVSGNAATFKTTITVTGGALIDGASSLVLKSNYASFDLLDTGTGYTIVRAYKGTSVDVSSITAYPGDITFNARADSATSVASMVAAEQFFPANGKRAFSARDLTGFSQARLVVVVATASTAASAPKLKAKYKVAHNYAADTAANFTDLGKDGAGNSAEIAVSLNTAGVIKSNWVDLADAARADVILTLSHLNGDGTSASTVSFGHVYLQVR